MLQCIAVCSSMLQGVAVCYSVLQCVAMCCSALHIFFGPTRRVLTEIHFKSKMCRRTKTCTYANTYTYKSHVSTHRVGVVHLCVYIQQTHTESTCLCAHEGVYITHAHVYIYTYIYIHIYIYIYIYKYIYMYIYVYVHIYTCTHICIYIHEYLYTYVYTHSYLHIYLCIYIPLPNCYTRVKHTGWRRFIGSPKLQIIFHKRATKYRSLLRKMTYKDKGSCESSPPCMRVLYPSIRKSIHLIIY